MSHLSDNCPVCHKSFVQGDDVVICPECGAPYHRACYEKQNNCVFAHKHAPGFEYISPQKKEAQKSEQSAESAAPNSQNSRTTGGTLCKSCSTINDVANIFCEKCGKPLHGEMPKAPVGVTRMGSIFGGGVFGAPPTPNLAGDIDGIEKKDWVSFIGPSAGIYLARMTQMKQRGGKISFMISAFFLGPFYFVYRKMWGWAGLAALVSILLLIPEVISMLFLSQSPLTANLSVSMLDNLQNWTNIATLIFNSLCGLFALYLYQRHGTKKIRLLQKQNDGAPLSHETLAKAGGITNFGLVVALVIIIGIATLLAYYIGPEGLEIYFSNYFQI